MLDYRVIHWIENETDKYMVAEVFNDKGYLFCFELINEPWSRKYDCLKRLFESFLTAFDKPIIERSEIAGQMIKCEEKWIEDTK
jgi:hypothetical protein